MSGWNSRVESMVIGSIICLSTILAFILKRKITGSISWSDLCIPVIFLSLRQYEIFSEATNISHGSGPLLLLMLYCIVWAMPISNLHYFLIIITNFLMIYTGFGIFIGLITPAMLGLYYFYNRKTWKGINISILTFCILLSIISMASFFIDYKFIPAVPDFTFPVQGFWHKYPTFICIMVANFSGATGLEGNWQKIIGLATLITMAAIYLIHIRIIIQGLLKNHGSDDTPQRISQLIVILLSYSFIFCISTAVGRISIGVDAGIASRYTSYLIPAFLAVYLHVITLTENKFKRRLIAATVLFYILTMNPYGNPGPDIEYLKNGKENWKKCYLKHEDIDKADKEANFQIYPTPERTDLKGKLNYLKDKKYNLFLDV